MTDEPECYPNLHAVPTKRLATNIVGSIILAKGNINRWGMLIERFLTDYRVEEEDREQRIKDLERALKRYGAHDDQQTCRTPTCACLSIDHEHGAGELPCSCGFAKILGER